MNNKNKLKMRNRIYFKGVKEERETPEERIKRKQLEFKKQYNAYTKRVLNQIIYEEGIE